MYMLFPSDTQVKTRLGDNVHIITFSPQNNTCTVINPDTWATHTISRSFVTADDDEIVMKTKINAQVVTKYVKGCMVCAILEQGPATNIQRR